MGTFDLALGSVDHLDSVSQRGVGPTPVEGWSKISPSGSLDANLISAINGNGFGLALSSAARAGTGSLTKSGTIRFSWTTLGVNIVVDGVPTSFAGLPSGFRVISAILSVAGITFNASQGNIPLDLLGGSIKIDANSIIDTITYTIVPVSGATINIGTKTLTYDFSSGRIAKPSILDICLNGFVLTVTISDTSVLNLGYLRAVFGGGVTLSGTYVIDSYSISPTTVRAFDVVTVDGDTTTIVTLNAYNSSGVLITSPPILSNTGTSLTFYVDVPTLGPVYIFSGSVLLGVLTMLDAANTSGIYRIVTDKTADTIYLSSDVGALTADVAIPMPFARTGFIGG